MADGLGIDEILAGYCFTIDSHTYMCDDLHMATNLALDDHLIEEARRVGKHKTKKDAVNAALDEYVRRHKQMKILDAFGTVTFDSAYDYKAERRRSRGAGARSRP
jgi:Arc/MetJ family transcription regulator